MKLTDDQKRMLTTGILCSLGIPLGYVLFSLISNKPIADALEGALAGVIGMWVMLGLMILGSKTPKKKD